MTTTTDSSRFSTLLRQASQWRLMALLLSRPAQTWGEQVKALRAEVGDDELIAAADAACAAASSPFYDTTFGPGGPAAPR